MRTVVVVEDNKLIQDYLVDLLEKSGQFRIGGRYADAFEAEQACERGGVDLVLMDIQTAHNHSGLTAGKRIRAMGRGTKVVAVTSLVDPDVLAQARSGGADSLWYKDHGSRDLLWVIDRTLAGERVFPDSAPSIELGEMFSGDITPRQHAILRRMVLGYSYDEIAADLKITKDGVRWNIEQLIDKGGFANRHELLAAVLSNKYVAAALLKE